MNDTLHSTGPDFDQPIAVLKHCHDKIRKQLQTLQRLLAHLPTAGADAEAQQAATAILRYFREAAPNHHADEEDDLLPMLQATATGEDLAVLQTLQPQILAEHREMELIWIKLAAQLEDILSGAATELAHDDVARFVSLYTAHMEKEEARIAPMAKRLFGADQMQRLGLAMRVRRHID